MLAIIQHWDLGITMFIYWAQSIFIDFYTVIFILDLKACNTPPGEMQRAFHNSVTDADARKFFPFYKLVMAGFFTVHYGLFHWACIEFISSLGFLKLGDIGRNIGVLMILALFFSSHLYSFLYYRRAEPLTGSYISALFFRPYARIISMHITIIVAGFVVIALTLLGLSDPTPIILVIFLVIKTYVDAWMHVNKHRKDMFLPG